MKRTPEITIAMAFPVLGTSSAFVATGWMPVIHHPDRTAPYTRWERYPRKTKLTANEALTYAARAIWYRQRRENEKRRRLEAIDPRLAATIEGRAA